MVEQVHRLRMKSFCDKVTVCLVWWFTRIRSRRLIVCRECTLKEMDWHLIKNLSGPLWFLCGQIRRRFSSTRAKKQNMWRINIRSPFDCEECGRDVHVWQAVLIRSRGEDEEETAFATLYQRMLTNIAALVNTYFKNSDRPGATGNWQLLLLNG